MARLTIDLPPTVLFRTSVDITIADINYGQHMGHDAALRLAHEARVRWLKSLDYSELNIEGFGIIVSDAAVMYKSEVFHGDTLSFELGLTDHNRYGFDIVYTASNTRTQQETLRIKTGVVFFDYQQRKVAPAPMAFTARLAAHEKGNAP
ncbi:MAG: acyl-CoA thioesterase [Vogesella sp.]|uniref:acyl-CoA thioesterase n=1 Tax=Vogesella sp. TaxID=1904252 RepID=UPI003F2F5443